MWNSEIELLCQSEKRICDQIYSITSTLLIKKSQVHVRDIALLDLNANYQKQKCQKENIKPIHLVLFFMSNYSLFPTRRSLINNDRKKQSLNVVLLLC